MSRLVLWMVPKFICIDIDPVTNKIYGFQLQLYFSYYLCGGDEYGLFHFELSGNIVDGQGVGEQKGSRQSDGYYHNVYVVLGSYYELDFIQKMLSNSYAHSIRKVNQKRSKNQRCYS